MTATQPTFLYPTSRQFPFDEVCERIVRALEERNWSVPGIDVEFDVYGTGQAKYRLVRHIKSRDFKLWFCRAQARLGDWNDTAAVTEIVIPRKELHVYEDESGPTLYVYAGKNWQKDKDRWLNASKSHSKLDDEPRWYLKYKGGCICESVSGASFEAIGFLMGDSNKHTHRGQRPPLLIADNDLGREYDPKGKEPRAYATCLEFDDFTNWLQSNVLEPILKQPAADEKIDTFRESVTPYPEHLDPIFCFGETKDAHRVHTGKTDPEELDASNRYGFTGDGWRLAPLGTRNDGTVPEIAFDGFMWCGFGDVNEQSPIDTLDVPGLHTSSDREKYVFRVTPNRADGIYVADHAAYEERREELFEAIKPRDRLRNDEVDETLQARGRTIIPITEYTGGYKQPVVLINREVDFDEVELVSGPWPEYICVKILTSRFPRGMPNNPLYMVMATLEDYYLNFANERRDNFNQAVQILFDLVKDDAELAVAAEEYGRHIFRKTKLDTHFIERIVEVAVEMRDLGLGDF